MIKRTCRHFEAWFRDFFSARKAKRMPLRTAPDDIIHILQRFCMFLKARLNRRRAGT